MDYKRYKNGHNSDIKHHYYFCRKFGFTLAEVLITLGIIGVVAALVMPTIYSNYFEKMVVAKVKQTYSIMSNVVEEVIAEHDCGWIEISNNNKSIEPIANELDKHFKYTKKICTPLTGSVEKISWLPDSGYYITGNTTKIPTHSVSNGNINNICYYRLNNGVNMSIYRANQFDTNGANILYIIMDANGKSGPNRVGKDVFAFTSAPSTTSTFASGYTNAKNNRLTAFFALHPYFTPSIYQAGLCADYWTWIREPACEISEKTPAAYVLTHGKLPDLTKIGYPAKP